MEGDNAGFVRTLSIRGAVGGKGRLGLTACGRGLKTPADDEGTKVNSVQYGDLWVELRE